MLCAFISVCVGRLIILKNEDRRFIWKGQNVFYVLLVTYSIDKKCIIQRSEIHRSVKRSRFEPILQNLFVNFILILFEILFLKQTITFILRILQFALNIFELFIDLTGNLTSPIQLVFIISALLNFLPQIQSFRSISLNSFLPFLKFIWQLFFWINCHWLVQFYLRIISPLADWALVLFILKYILL